MILKKLHWTIWIIFWVVMLGMPIAYFFVGPQLVAPPGPLTGLYDSTAQLIGERTTRFIFCSIWLTFGFVLFWRLVLKNDRDKISLESPDLHD
jgi:hypothetical protein